MCALFPQPDDFEGLTTETPGFMPGAPWIDCVQQDAACFDECCLVALHTSALSTVDDRVVGVGADLVAALADHGVGSGTGLAPLVASVDPIGLGPSGQGVGPLVVSEVVGPGVAVQPVVALLAVDVVAPILAIQDVVLVTAARLVAPRDHR